MSTSIPKFLETKTGRILYNLGIIVTVFTFMSLGMNVFAERPGDRSDSVNLATTYLWRMAHAREITEMGKQIDYTYGRLYLYKRMQGDPSSWGWEQKDEYDQMYAAHRTLVERYNDLVAQYNGSDSPLETGVAPKAHHADYMPYATR